LRPHYGVVAIARLSPPPQTNKSSLVLSFKKEQTFPYGVGAS
jgi:hypothetical protein